MTDFEKNLTIRIEKAAQRTLADRVNAVDWERLPVDKIGKNIFLAFLAWKVGVPVAMGILRVIQCFILVVVCFLLLQLCRVMTAPLPPGHVAGVDNPAPRAELVQPDENEYRAHHILHPAHR